jgi:hypothetical protein
MAGVRQLKAVGKRDVQSLLLQDQRQQCSANERVRTCLRPRWGLGLVPPSTHGLGRGLHSDAVLRLKSGVARVVTDNPLRDAAGFRLALAFLILKFHDDGKDSFTGAGHIP